MSAFLSFLAAESNGILLLLFVLIVLAGLLNWMLWMFSFGRYRGSSSQEESKLRFVLTDFLVRIFNEFRHVLALMIFLLFAATLLLATLPGVASGRIQDIKEGVEAVAAGLGGLIGSIIGYYFGESSAGRSQPRAPNLPPAPAGPAVQPEAPDPTVRQPPEPPVVEGT